MKNTYSVNNNVLMVSTSDSCELFFIPNNNDLANEVATLKEMGFVEAVNVHA